MSSDGNTVECCGIEQCGNISEEKVYNDPVPNECCSTQSGYSFEYLTETSCDKVSDKCTVKRTGPYYSSGSQNQSPKYKCSGSCPDIEICEGGIKTGYQQYAWEVLSEPWSSPRCPEGSVYKKTDCQTICGGTTGCRTICKNSCEKLECAKKEMCETCEQICNGTTGCHLECKKEKCPNTNNPYSVTSKLH